MPKTVFSTEKLILQANQKQFFNLPRKQIILSEYIKEEKKDIALVGERIAKDMQNESFKYI